MLAVASAGAGNWGEVTKLTASDAQTEDLFGISVAVSGDTVVVGALGDDAGGAEAGTAYVFEAPAVVGGIAELPEVAGTPLDTPDSSGSNIGLLATVAGAIAAGALALGGAAWYARRRWAR